MGATNTVIPGRVADEVSLRPTGVVEVQTTIGQSRAETYLLSLILPNHVGFTAVPATAGKIQGADVLIGMDLIHLGDCAISNAFGPTVVTFRSSAVETIDFVKEVA